ncbi:MAG: transposase [Acidobacteria bacterium]|nr:transposase [Acidobacteriota bacterium]
MQKQRAIPLGYLITFSCYGTHLHGDQRGSTTIYLNEPGTPTIPSNPELVEENRKRMRQGPYRLDQSRRRIALEAVLEVCTYKQWSLYAAHVRAEHIHVVVHAPTLPEPVMNALKARISFRLNETGIDHPGKRRWTRHGSTRYLWTMEDIRNAIRYVVEKQGEPLEVFKDNLIMSAGLGRSHSPRAR